MPVCCAWVPVQCTRHERLLVLGRSPIRHGPPHERFQSNSAGWRPTMGLVRARTVAIRPGTLMDRQAAIPGTGMKCPVGCGLALPVNDVSCRQVRPPPNARATKPICYGRRLLQHPPPTPSLPLFMEGTDFAAALLLGGRAHFGLRLESVTRSRDGLDVARRAPLVVELHAELANVPIDDIALDLELTAPDRGKKIFPADRLSGLRRQKVDEGQVRSPVVHEISTLLRVRRSAYLVLPVLERQRHEVPEGLVHHDQGSG